MKNTFIVILVFLGSLHSFSQKVYCDSVSTSIHYKSGKYSLTKLAEIQLLELIEELIQADCKEIILVGHTDIHGDYDYNLQLSKKRVETVSDFINREISVTIRTEFFGEDQLKEKISTIDNDSINRRVEIKYYILCQDTSDHLSNKTRDLDNGIHVNSSNTFNENMDKSIIYKNDKNCHIDTIIVNEIYNNVFVQKSSNIVVADWTRSMYPYGLSLLDWFIANKNIANFSSIFLFNDGDAKKTRHKINGITGGIYNISFDSIENVVQLMQKVAEKGTGGDYPENVIEALLSAQNKFPEADTIILLADNRACIRDYTLIEKLTKPVKVILNEIDTVQKILNYQYLNLAAHTNGQVYFMNEKISIIKFSDVSFGPKPTPGKDTLIILPKIKHANYKEAKAQLEKMKLTLNKYATPPILVIDDQKFISAFDERMFIRFKENMIKNSSYKIGAPAYCFIYDFELVSSVKFEETYTLWQKCQKWYGNSSIKCIHCKNKKERKACRKAQERKRAGIISYGPSISGAVQ